MRPSMKLGKHVEDRNCLDRISSLPDEVLAHILSFLPSRCAVGTSILWTRWRYLFTLTTSLSFDDTPYFVHMERNEIIALARSFKEFVDKVLELHQISPINKFSLLCGGAYDNSDLNRWVSIAVRKGVQELHINLFGPPYGLPNGVFMCETLVIFKITCYESNNRIQIPLSPSLPKLKILHLDNIVFFDFKSMERLFSSCELLEELTLKCCESHDTHGHVIHRSGILKVLTIERCCFILGTFEIDAPNLAYLTWISNIGVKIVPSWKYLCSFVKVELTFKCSYDDFDIDEDLVNSDCALLDAAAYKTTKLCFEIDSVQVLVKLGDNEQMPDFHSLSRLQLGDCPYDLWKYLTSLLDKSPRLETVVFTSFHCCHCSGHCCCDSLSPSDIPLNPFSCHAQVIEVHDFCGHKGSLLLVGHLLRNASVLKQLIIFTICNFDSEEEMKITNDLLMLPRASIDCCLELNNKGN